MKRFLLLIMFIFSYTTIFCTVGVLDTNFSTDGKLTQDINGAITQNAYAVAVQKDGKILVGGTDNAGNFCLARFEQDGTLDTSFDTDGIVTTAVTLGVIYGLAVQPDGKIIAVGTNGTHFVIVRYLSNGSLDTGFDGDGGTGNGIVTVSNSWAAAAAYAVTIQPADGKILVAGIADAALVVIRLSGTDGVLDTSFDSDGIAVIVSMGNVTSVASSIGLTSAGKIICAGGIATGNAFVTQLTSAGALDTVNFNAADTGGYEILDLGGTDAFYALGLQSTGKIVCAGTDGTNVAVARFTIAGVLDTSFGVSSSGYNVAQVMGGTVARANGLVIQSDDKIVMAGTVTDTDQEFFIARYFANGSDIDTTFNPTTGYTKTDFDGLLDDAKAIAMQDDNKFVVAGSSVSTDYGAPTYFAVARYVGEAAPQSAFDFDYGADNNGFITYPTSSTAAHKNVMRSAVTLTDGSTIVLTESTVTTLQSQLVQLDDDGVALTSVCNIAKTGASDCIVDSQGRIIVVGTQNGDGWIARYTITAGAPGTIALDADFNGGAILVVSAASAFTKVCENRDGRIIVLGLDNTPDGAIFGYTQAGVLDATFGTSGVCVVASYTFSDMIINSLGKIYVIGLHNAYLDVYDILLFDADGNGGTASFSVTTAFDPLDYDYPFLAVGVDDAIYCVANNATANSVVFEKYGSDTSITFASTFNFSYDGMSINSMTLQQLQCDDQGDLLFAGYSDHFSFIGKTNAMTALETTFAPNEEIPGVMTFKYDNNNPSDTTTPQRKTTNVVIDSVGAIMVAGHENVSSSATVTFVGKLLGDQTTPALQAARYPGFLVGSVDLSFGTDGEMSLKDTAGANTGLGNARVMHVYDSGKVLLAIENGADLTIVKLDDDYTADTTFGGGDGVMTVASFGQPTSILFAFDGSILISGGIAGSDSGKVVNIAADGSSVLWTSPYTIDYCYGVLQQSLTRLIMFGKDGSNGVLVALNPEDGTLDESFGVDGVFSLGLNLPIVSAVLDVDNNIIIAYKNGTESSVITSILPDGSAINFTFAGADIDNIASSTDLKLAIDANQKYVLVVKNSSSDFVAHRYTSLGADDAGPITITLGANSVFKNIMTLDDGSTLILGYDSVSYEFIVARILPNFSGLDTDFGTAGISQDTVGDIQQFNAFGVTPDAGILIAGYHNADLAAALTRLVNDSVVLKVDQNQSVQATQGALDTTFGDPGILFYATAGDIASYSQVARAVAMYGNNHYAVALDGTEGAGNKIFMNVFDVDGNLETDFSTDGQDVIFDTYDDQYVTDMVTFLNPSGVMTGLLCGYIGNDAIATNRGLLLQYLLDTAAIDTTFGGLYGDDAGTVTGSAAQYFGVARQPNGRIITAGISFDDLGVLVGYTASGIVDRSFAQEGLFNGHEYTTGFYSHAVDSQGRIVTASSNDDEGEVEVFRVLADGSALDSTFNSVGFIAMAQDSQTPNQIKVAVDLIDRIYAAIVYNSNYFLVSRYSEDGLTVDSYSIIDTIFGADLLAAVSLTIGQLLIDINNQPIICGVMTDGNNNSWYIVIRLLADMSGLDTTFNGTGFIKYQIDSSIEQALVDAMITQEGRIVAVGSERYTP